MKHSTSVFLALSIIFILAFSVRVYRLTDRIRWWGDIARDLMVSKHLVLYEEELINGHSASGVTFIDPVTQEFRLLHYPTFYYRYLAILWRFFFCVERIVLFNVLVQCLAIFPLYATLQLLHKNSTASLLACLLYGLAALSVNVSLIIVGHQVSVPFIITALYLFTLGWKKNNSGLLLTGLIGLTFLTTFQYSLLIIVALLSAALVIRAIAHKTNVFSSLSYGTLAVIFFFVIHIQQLNYFGFKTFITPFFTTNSEYSFEQHSLSQQIKARIYDSRITQLAVDDTDTTKIVLVSFVAGLVLLNIFSLKTELFPAIFFITTLIFTFYLFAISKSSVYLITYLLYSDYAWIYLISFWIPVLNLRLKTAGGFVGGLIMLGAIFFASAQLRYLKQERIFYEFVGAKRVAQIILQKYSQRAQFRVGSYHSQNFEDAAVGYWMETLSSHKLYRLTNKYMNIERLNSDPQNYIVICQEYLIEQARAKGFCEAPTGYKLLSSSDLHGYIMNEYIKE